MVVAPVLITIFPVIWRRRSRSEALISLRCSIICSRNLALILVPALRRWWRGIMLNWTSRRSCVAGRWWRISWWRLILLRWWNWPVWVRLLRCKAVVCFIRSLVVIMVLSCVEIGVICLLVLRILVALLLVAVVILCSTMSILVRIGFVPLCNVSFRSWVKLFLLCSPVLGLEKSETEIFINTFKL